MITFATWNVLHRVHGENWGEGVIAHWPDESERIAAVTALLEKRPEQVIALQEVSGDQFDSLRRAVPRTVHALRSPRVPKARRGAAPLTDADEYLVLLVDGPSAEVAAESFPDALGKGFLAVRVADVLVIATHVAWDHRGPGHLARLTELASQAETAVLLGDFNAEPEAVASAFGAGFTVADPGGPTRPPGQRIDHVVVRGARVVEAAVEDVDGLSDHNLVRATVSI